MLVLTRKKGESIIVQDNIEITILSVEGDVVKVGINAPKHVDIFREEVYISIKEANKESAAPAPTNLDALMERLRKQK
ncbi:carbon storage regulator CsrA [Paenibacillus sp. MMS20-IR301]|uniref:carbon storage regulator CsrA n=1 Tax=Paenibacillus sp. MMS20-IR301 TaxID=2895946 RepID=UPI0028E71980|nr:carbon storage regulator CsrA [Paenibacillus sp. MMS20-IR301]WNS47063.1 carbon storage regulator CsrA [Paenibacillus sp. MMS20-IR301]